MKGVLSGGGVQKEEEKCPCEWLSSTCKHAGLSAVTVKTSSRNDNGHVCVGCPSTHRLPNAIIDVQMGL